MRPRVFVSYARQDGEQAATELTQRLGDAAPDLEVWRDRTNLEAGRGWWAQITGAIDESNFLLLVMTPAAFRSDVVRREWQYARQQGVCVYPVLAEGHKTAFGVLPRWMRKAHFHNLSREWDTLLAHLRRACESPRVPFMASDPPVRYVARTAELTRLRAALLGDMPDSPAGGVVVLHGPGGFGKTTLANAVCHDDAVQAAFDDGVLWTTLGEHASVPESLSTLYRALTGELVSFADAREGSRRLVEKLGDRNCLIVVDDVWSPDDLDPFLQGGPGCTRLVTTRRADLALEGAAVAVDEMAAREARQLLAMAFASAPPPAARLDDLARRLGQWPLLLELVAASLRLRVARGDTAESAVDALENRLAERGIVAFDQRDSNARERAVSRTLDISLQLLDPEERAGLEQLSIFPGDVDVPIAAAERLWRTDTVATEERFERLANLALVQLDLGAATFRLHDVIRGYVAARLADAAAAHARLLDAWGDPMALPDTYAWRWYAYHAAAAGRTDVIHTLLFNGEWLSRRLTHGALAQVIGDYRRLENDPDGRTMAEVLRICGHILAADASQLASQLLGRLPSPRSVGLDALASQVARGVGRPWLRPLRQSLSAPGGPLRRTLPTGHRVNALAVNADGSRAAAGTADGVFTTWDLTTGDCLRRAEAPGPAPRDGWYYVVITPDGRRAALASFSYTSPSSPNDPDASLIILDLEADPPRELMRDAISIRDLALSAEGDIVLAATTNPDAIRGWSAEDGAEVFALDAAAPFEVAASRGAARLVYRGTQGLYVHDLQEGPPPVSSAPDFTEWAQAIALSTSGDHLIVQGFDALEMWSLSSGERHARFAQVPMGPLAATPDASRVISGDQIGGGVLVLDTLHERTLVRLSTERVTAVAISADGGTALAAHDNLVRVLAVDRDNWDWSAPPTAAVAAVTPRRHRRDAVVGTADGDVSIRTGDGGHGPRLRLEQPLSALAVDDDGNIVVATGDGTLVIWDPDGDTSQRLALDATATAIAPAAGGTLALGATDGTVRLIERATGATRSSLTVVPPSPFESHVAIPTMAAFANGMVVLGSLEDLPDFGKTSRTLTAWDPVSNTSQELDAVFEYRPSRLAVVSIGNRSFAATLGSGAIGVWHIDATGATLGLTIDLGLVTALCATPTGEIVAANAAGEIHLWDHAAGRSRVIATNATGITAVAVSPDGTRCLASSSEGVLRVHALADDALVATFHADSALTGSAWLDDATIVAGEQLGRVHVLSVERA